MAAGHPRISFELDLFTTLQQHYTVDDDYRERGKNLATGTQVWATGQALMEPGARFCRARPACGECPVRDACAWHSDGAHTPDPAATPVRRPAQRFADSDRYHRGRLLDALRAGAVAEDDVAPAARADDADRARRLADALVSEGLAEWRLGTLTLPERHPERRTCAGSRSAVCDHVMSSSP